MARGIGTRQDGSAHIFLPRPSLFSFNHDFLRTRLVKYFTVLKRNLRRTSSSLASVRKLNGCGLLFTMDRSGTGSGRIQRSRFQNWTSFSEAQFCVRSVDLFRTGSRLVPRKHLRDRFQTVSCKKKPIRSDSEGFWSSPVPNHVQMSHTLLTERSFILSICRPS